MHPDEWSTRLLWEKLVVAPMMVERIRHRGLSTRNSDEVRVGVDTDRLHSSDNSITNSTTIRWHWSAATTRWRWWHDHSKTIRDTELIVRPQINNSTATIRGSRSNSRTWWFNGLRTIRWRNDSMPYDQRSPQRLEDFMIQWLADDSMAWCYNDEMEKKTENGYEEIEI